MTGRSTSDQGAPRPTSSASGVLTLLGRIVAFALIVGAGVAGWFGVEEFELSIGRPGSGSAALAESLPELGDGLPDARLQSPTPWRRFALTYQDAAQTNRFWVDLDSWQLRIESTNADAMSAVEINGDRSFTRPAVDDEWVERNGQETRDLASWLMSGIGPFVLTDLVPPNALGFTTLELEGTSRDERVYEVVVDAATLQAQHPLAHQRWTAATRIVNDASGVYRIRVREDGYIVRIDGETSSVQWEALDGAVVFFSPLSLEVAPTPATAPPVESSVPATAAVTDDSVRSAAVDRPIGMFDSGFGGLTVARATIDLLPAEDLVYIGDTGRYPYGSKPLSEVRVDARELAHSLVADYGAKAIVVACNTATAAGLDDLRAELDVPIIDVIAPGAQALVQTTVTGRVGVIGTVGTVSSGAYVRAIAETGAPVTLSSAACPGFVEFVERGQTVGDEVTVLAERLLAPVREADVDALLLGCTHYPFLARTISDVMGHGVTLVSSADETAFAVQRRLTELGLVRSGGGRGRHRFASSGDINEFRELGRQLLGPELDATEPWPPGN